MEKPSEAGVVKAPMAGLEGGSDATSSSGGGGLFASIASLFRDMRQEAEAAGQDFQSGPNVDVSTRLNRFAELSKDQQRLRSSAAALSVALGKAASAHEKLAERFRFESKAFADQSSVVGLQDGVVDGHKVLESPKDGLESERFAQAAARQTRAADALKKLERVIQDLAQTMLVFHDKILNDLYETVKVYRRAQVALDGARGESDLIALQTNCSKAKEAVDVKILLLTEKRFRDLQSISLQLETHLVECIKESQAAFQ